MPINKHPSAASIIPPKTSQPILLKPPDLLTLSFTVLIANRLNSSFQSLSSYPPLTYHRMSLGTTYEINDFSLYLMPKQAAPQFLPCQSDSLPSVFEDDEDDFEVDQCEMTVLFDVNKAVRKMIVRLKVPKSPKPFLSSRLRSSTLSSQISQSPPSSTRSGASVQPLSSYMCRHKLLKLNYVELSCTELSVSGLPAFDPQLDKQAGSVPARLGRSPTSQVADLSGK
ncbi:hypothetical protein MJO28_015620 [Puccinia striiformis f. sp. tritici]|uniref:Uncharacterized protein n=1 Tax=Puccinia striiformis f. sp. tritici TaxID=168172 RepID=A0ACC0DPI3_9BASI|nr:hypothetical protein MJO28_015620 [Puccinia striiformis f. sp. tritici]